MAVPQEKRSHAKLEVIVKAMELASYTVKICSNPKIFKPEFDHLLTHDIVHCAKEIYTNSWKANNIDCRNDVEMARIRNEYQAIAIVNCYELLALIQLAKPVYHLTSKRIEFWGERTIEVRQMLKAWKSSDSKRFNY